MKRLLIMVAAVAMSGCPATLQGRVSVNSDLPFWFGGTLAIMNSAGDGVEIIPSSRGREFVSEYRHGSRQWYCLWLCREKIPVEILVLANGDNANISIFRNGTGQTIEVPVTLKILRGKRLVGFYNLRVCAYSNRDSFQTINFNEDKLRGLTEFNQDSETLCR